MHTADPSMGGQPQRTRIDGRTTVCDDGRGSVERCEGTHIWLACSRIVFLSLTMGECTENITSDQRLTARTDGATCAGCRVQSEKREAYQLGCCWVRAHFVIVGCPDKPHSIHFRTFQKMYSMARISNRGDFFPSTPPTFHASAVPLNGTTESVS